MDVVEFAEKIFNVELLDWQKDHIRYLYDKYQSKGDVRIVMPKDAGKHQVYIYMKTVEELLSNGSTNDCKL